MSDRSETATPPEVTDDSLPVLVARNVPREDIGGPTRPALVHFYQVLEGIILERCAPLKPQGKGNPGGKPCQPKD